MSEQAPNLIIEPVGETTVDLEAMLEQSPELAARIVKAVETADREAIPRPLELI